MPARTASRVLLAMFVLGLVLVASGLLAPGAPAGLALVLVGAAALVVVATAVCLMAVWRGASPWNPRG